MPDKFGYLTIEDLRARIPRLADRAQGLFAEWARQSGPPGLLTPGELQQYRTAIWQAAKGFEEARLVLEKVVARIERAG
jgi:hypothetical protein